MRRGRQGRIGLAGVVALAFGLLPAAAPAEEAAPILALMAAQCSDPAEAPPMPEGWAQVPGGTAAPLIAGIAGLEARLIQVLELPLADEPELEALLARRAGAWLAETSDRGMQAQLWQQDGTPALTLLRAAANPGIEIVECRLMIEDAPPALTEALARRFEILPETQGMQARVWAGGAEQSAPAGRETHSRALLILPDWTPRTDNASILVSYGLTRMAR